MGNDRARRILILALLLTLAADALFPRSGPTATVLSASFWLYALAIVAFAVRQLVLRSRHGSAVPVLKWGLLAVCVVSLYVYGAFLERGTPAARATAFLLFGTFVALVVLAIRDAIRGRRGTPHARRDATVT